MGLIRVTAHPPCASHVYRSPFCLSSCTHHDGRAAAALPAALPVSALQSPARAPPAALPPAKRCRHCNHAVPLLRALCRLLVVPSQFALLSRTGDPRQARPCSPSGPRSLGSPSSRSSRSLGLASSPDHARLQPRWPSPARRRGALCVWCTTPRGRAVRARLLIVRARRHPRRPRARRARAASPPCPRPHSTRTWPSRARAWATRVVLLQAVPRCSRGARGTML